MWIDESRDIGRIFGAYQRAKSCTSSEQNDDFEIPKSQIRSPAPSCLAITLPLSRRRWTTSLLAVGSHLLYGFSPLIPFTWQVLICVLVQYAARVHAFTAGDVVPDCEEQAFLHEPANAFYRPINSRITLALIGIFASAARLLNSLAIRIIVSASTLCLSSRL
jgi:hypothetical protein